MEVCDCSDWMCVAINRPPIPPARGKITKLVLATTRYFIPYSKCELLALTVSAIVRAELDLQAYIYLFHVCRSPVACQFCCSSGCHGNVTLPGILCITSGPSLIQTSIIQMPNYSIVLTHTSIEKALLHLSGMQFCLSWPLLFG